MVFFEIIFELKVIRNYSVMYYCDPIFMVKMWMCIQVSLIAVSGPPRVSDSQKFVVLTLGCIQ